MESGTTLNMNTLSSNFPAIDIPAIDIVDITEAVVDTAGDAVDVATQVTATGGRIIVRTARAGGRYVRRHPKGSFGTFLLIATLLAGATWFRRRSGADESSTDLRVAA